MDGTPSRGCQSLDGDIRGWARLINAEWGVDGVAEDFIHVLEQKQKRGFAPWRLHQMFCVQILKFWHLCSLGTGAEKVESAFQVR